MFQVANSTVDNGLVNKGYIDTKLDTKMDKTITNNLNMSNNKIILKI